MSAPTIHDSVRLSQRDLEQLLSDLNRSQQASPSASKRKARRWTVPLSKAVCSVLDSGKRLQHHLVVPRNLSTGGIAVLMGAFVYAGTRCTVTLRRLDGKGQPINGVVVRCQHLKGHLHDIGVKFDAPISARDFIDFGDQHSFSVESVDPSKLKGSVLIIEDSRADQRLYAHHFKGSGLELQFAQDGETGLQSLSDLPDLLFTDYQLPDMTGIDVITRARAKGYAGPIVLITAEVNPLLRSAALKAGASEMLAKPFTAALLLQAAAEYLMSVDGEGPKASAAKMVSNADEKAASREMVEDYVSDLQSAADQIGAAIERDAFHDVRALVLQVKGSAATYGFEALTRIASDTARTLDACQSVQESMTDLQRLMASCHCVRAAS